MTCVTILEDEHELVRAAIKRAHAGGVFRPYAEVLELGLRVKPGLDDLDQMPPVHAYKMNRARSAVPNQEHECFRQEACEFFVAHLAACHRELTVMNFSKTADVSFDSHVIRRIDKRHRGPVLSKQSSECRGVESITATNSVNTQLP